MAYGGVTGFHGSAIFVSMYSEVYEDGRSIIVFNFRHYQLLQKQQ